MKEKLEDVNPVVALRVLEELYKVLQKIQCLEDPALLLAAPEQTSDKEEHLTESSRFPSPETQ